MKNTCVLQPFSNLLFIRGPPAGPHRLIRKLEGEVTCEQALEEWAHDASTDEVKKISKDENNPMTTTHLCACCYLKRKATYMHPAKAFGVHKATDFYQMYLSQGSWSRCLQCQQEAGVVLTRATQPSSSSPAEQPTISHGAAKYNGMSCAVCSVQAANKEWKHELECDTHG